MQAVVVDPEVVGDLVQHRRADLDHHLFLGTADRLDRLLVDENAVGQGAAVVAAP